MYHIYLIRLVVLKRPVFDHKIMVCVSITVR